MDLKYYSVARIGALFLVSLLPLSNAVRLIDSAYKDIFVSFSPLLSQKRLDLSKFETIVQKATAHLFRATRRRSYFSEFTVVIPHQWDESLCESYVSKTEPGATSRTSIYFQPTAPVRTQHSKPCGSRGEMILLPIQWLDNDQDEDQLARELVRQWAIFRYGVFEETPVRLNSCFTSDLSRWGPTGCYNAESNNLLDFDADGLPMCDFENDDLPGMSSSIMFQTESNNVTDFCDGSKTFPHSPVAETRHNILCDRWPTWKVIENNEDFRYGKNPPIEDSSFVPKVSLKCFREQPPNLHFLIQNSSISDVTATISEVRHAILRFLLFSLSPTRNVSLTTFSDESKTANGLTIFPQLSDRSATRALLKENIRATSPVSNICLVCGLRKINEVPDGDPHSLVVLILLASALVTTSYQDLSIQLDMMNRKLFLLTIEDEAVPALPGDVIQAIYAKGGCLYYLPLTAPLLNTEMNIALINVMQNHFHYEASVIVVHQSTFTNVASNLLDSFLVDEDLQGELTYTLKCNSSDMIDIKNSACQDLEDLKDGNFICGFVSTVLPGNESTHTWGMEFKYLGGIPSLTCSSLATIRLAEPHKSQVSLNGWLSHHEIRPEEDRLVIYAELLNNVQTTSGAFVAASIYLSGFEKPISVLELRDNGNGDPDMKENDGIHSRYFSSFPMKGIYTVAIKAHLQTSSTEHSLGDVETAPSHSRVISIGSFVVLTDPPQMDIHPPNRIADLRLASVDHDYQIVTLTWTAPGGDYDNGQADAYEVFCSTNWQDLTDTSLSQTPMENILEDDMNIKPKPSGTKELQTVHLQKNITQLYYIAIRAKDRNANIGKISNTVQVFINPNSSKSTTVTDIMSETTTPNVDTSTDVVSPTAIPSNCSTVIRNAFEQQEIIIIAASSGGSILLLIIINLIVCIVCFRRRKKRCEPTERENTFAKSVETSDAIDLTVRAKQNISLEEDGNNSPHNRAFLNQDVGQLYSAISKKNVQINNFRSDSPVNKEAVERDMGYV